MNLAAVERITVSRDGASPVQFDPPSLDIDLSSFGITDQDVGGRLELRAPDGWRVTRQGDHCWQAVPVQLDSDQCQTFELIRHESGRPRNSWRRSIGVRLDLRTTFDPQLHAFPERNSASVLGDLRGRPEDIHATYAGMPGWAIRLLGRGLYRDIVYLASQGVHRGGLCSGMARWAGLRALAHRDAPVERDLALRQIVVLHGRQLTDRALLSSFGWFLRGSPGTAYRAVRDDALKHGLSLRALDVNVPKPWRRDIATAIVRQGHTVVPVRILQSSPGDAEVEVYDPNRGLDLQTIRFDLKRDRYAFRSMVSMEQDDVGIVATPHTAYARRGSAWLATIGSVIWLVIERLGARNADRSRRSS